MERKRTSRGRDMSAQPEIAKAFELVAQAFRQKPEHYYARVEIPKPRAGQGSY